MGLLDRVIRNSIGNAVDNAVGRAVERRAGEIINPLANKAVNAATEDLNRTAQAYGDASCASSGSYDAAQTNANAASLGSAFANLQNAATSYANAAAQNMKICPACGEGASADQRFCPNCGAQLPEMTAGQGAVCTQCGRQNTVGTKFCAGCGAKLPGAMAEEAAAQQKDGAVLAKWSTMLPAFPQWNCGGGNYELREYGFDNGYPQVQFSASGVSYAAVEQYKQLLKQYGFRPAGRYPSESNLYNKINGVCWCFSSDNAFVSDPGYVTLDFYVYEPDGGFDYVKPEPKKQMGFKDIFKF